MIVKPPSRGQAIRALLVFQIKLAIDGMKDFVLIPVSLVVGIFGILTGRGSGPLNKVLRLGQAFDNYVDLYGSVSEEKESHDSPVKAGYSSLQS